MLSENGYEIGYYISTDQVLKNLNNELKLRKIAEKIKEYHPNIFKTVSFDIRLLEFAKRYLPLFDYNIWDMRLKPHNAAFFERMEKIQKVEKIKRVVIPYPTIYRK